MGILFCLENTAYAARLGKGGQEPVSYTHLDVYKRQLQEGE